jgi:hypothetical protein
MPLIPRHIAQAVGELVGARHVVTVRGSIDLGSIAAEASGDATLAAAGAVLGDTVDWGFETDRLTGVNLAFAAFVSAAGLITIHGTNNNVAAGAAIDLAATVFVFRVMRRI